MGYSKKVVIYGDFIETKEYEKEIKEGIPRSPRVEKRVYNPFAQRREDNLRRTRRTFVRRVCEAITELGAPLLVTLTYQQNTSDLLAGYDDFRAFILRVRKEYPYSQAIAVPEFQKRGAIHYHVLMFGLPSTMGDVRTGRTSVEIGTERENRFFAKCWGQGFVDCVRTDGGMGLAFYLSKYMIKASQDLRLVAKKGYYMTRGIPKPLSFTGEQAELIMSRMEKNGLINESENRSVWLGLIKTKTYAR